MALLLGAILVAGLLSAVETMRAFFAVVDGTVVSVSPASVSIDDGHIDPTRFTVQYTMSDVAHIKRAELWINSRGYKQVGIYPVPVAKSGTLTVDIDGDFDFGPTVRVRTRCGADVSDWWIYETPLKAFRSLESVRLVVRQPPPGPDCRLEATVNEQDADLSGFSQDAEEMRAQIPTKALGYRRTSRRRLDFLLILRTERETVESRVKAVPFDE